MGVISRLWQIVSPKVTKLTQDGIQLLYVDGATDPNSSIVSGHDVTNHAIQYRATTVNEYPQLRLNGNLFISVLYQTGQCFKIYRNLVEKHRFQDEHFFISEGATPTAIANFGCIYCKNDNKLYFQDGAGVEHEVAFV